MPQYNPSPKGAHNFENHVHDDSAGYSFWGWGSKSPPVNSPERFSKGEYPCCPYSGLVWIHRVYGSGLRAHRRYGFGFRAWGFRPIGLENYSQEATVRGLEFGL